MLVIDSFDLVVCSVDSVVSRNESQLFADDLVACTRFELVQKKKGNVWFVVT